MNTILDTSTSAKNTSTIIKVIIEQHKSRMYTAVQSECQLCNHKNVNIYFNIDKQKAQYKSHICEHNGCRYKLNIKQIIQYQTAI